MKGIAVVVAVLVIPVAQYSVVPYFDVSGTVVDLMLITLALLVAFTSVGAMLAAIPAMAILAGLISDSSIVVLVLGYLPLLPLAYTFETELPYDLPTFARLAIAVALTSVWVRLLGAAMLLIEGASFGPAELLTASILPGFLLDTVAFLIVYGILRGVRLKPVSLPATEAALL
jgi:hypothetical protein